jgi:hypothetical protein
MQCKAWIRQHVPTPFKRNLSHIKYMYNTSSFLNMKRHLFSSGTLNGKEGQELPHHPQNPLNPLKVTLVNGLPPFAKNTPTFPPLTPPLSPLSDPQDASPHVSPPSTPPLSSLLLTKISAESDLELIVEGFRKLKVSDSNPNFAAMDIATRSFGKSWQA